MEILLSAILVALLALIALVLVLLSRIRAAGDPSQLDRTLGATIDASLKSEFLRFQESLHSEMDRTRSRVDETQRFMSEQAVKTLQTFGQMSDAVGRLTAQQEEAQRLGQSLRDLLQAPKLRGNYGEAILEEMLDRILPKGVWRRQETIDGGQQVDAVVVFKDIRIPIDAKFPRDDYLRYLDAPTAPEKSAAWKSYETALRIQIKSIKDKYIKPEKGTADFALMFIPSEAIYYETIADKNVLGEPSTVSAFAQSLGVIPVSPNTLYAFLQVVILGIHNIEILKSARQLQENLRSLRRDFDLFYARHEDIGKHLDKAAEAYRVGSGHVERYGRRLDATLELEAFDESSQAKEHIESEAMGNLGSGSPRAGAGPSIPGTL